MAQTAGATSLRNVVLEYATNGSDWTDISGVANKITGGTKKRNVGSAATGAADTPVVTVGKREPHELSIDIVYSEVSTEAFTLFDAAVDAATAIYLRYAPKGTATGNYRYTTDAGYISEMDMPSGDVGDGAPLMASLKHFCGKITRATIS